MNYKYRGNEVKAIICVVLSVIACASHSQVTGSEQAPIYIGFDGAYGQKTNTAPQAIEAGMIVAINEINQAGGVLNGRPLKLIKTDNKGVTARGKDNFIELSQQKDIVAVLGGKYSPISVETLPEAHRLKLPLISVWGSADQITDHSYKPSYSFRVSLKDEWGVEAMIERIAKKYKAKNACAFFPSTSWGRSADNVIKSKSSAYGVNFSAIRWYNWGDSSFMQAYKECLDAGGQALMFVGNEKEGAILFKEIAAMPANKRLPIVSHWGVSGGAIHELVGNDLGKIQVDIIQTFSFINNNRPKAKYLAEQVKKNNKLESNADILSPVGVAQAYDAVHLLALAIQKAKSSNREQIRNALEELPEYKGAIRDYAPAFTKENHDALSKKNVIFVSIGRNGTLVPIEQ